MKIMVVTPYLPHSRVGHGGGTAVRDLVRHLAFQNEVLLVTMVRPDESGAIAEVEELGVRVAPIIFQDANSTGFSRLGLAFNRTRTWCRSLSSGYPEYVEKYWSAEASAQIIDLVRDFQPQAIQIEYLQMSLFARDLNLWRNDQKKRTPRIILNTHELGSIPRHRRAEKASTIAGRLLASKEASQWETLQVDASHWADTTLCVTLEDKEAYEALGGLNLLTVPLGMDLDVVRPDRRPTSPPCCLFVGSFQHRPNVLAAESLINDIWPKVKSQYAEAQLIVVGRGSDDFLDRQLPKPEARKLLGISAPGFVDDLAPIFSSCKLFVAPLGEGGGIKIKILEAMARGIPIVTTTVGAEGIAQVQDDVMVITQLDDDFTQAILVALEDEQTEARALRARELMENKFSWKAISERLLEIYQEKNH